MINYQSPVVLLERAAHEVKDETSESLRLIGN